MKSADTDEGPVPLWKLENQVLGKCTYCDPNSMNIPNLEDAMRGYELPMGNPNPGESIIVYLHLKIRIVNILMQLPQAWDSIGQLTLFVRHKKAE